MSYEEKRNFLKTQDQSFRNTKLQPNSIINNINNIFVKNSDNNNRSD